MHPEKRWTFYPPPEVQPGTWKWWFPKGDFQGVKLQGCKFMQDKCWTLCAPLDGINFREDSRRRRDSCRFLIVLSGWLSTSAGFHSSTWRYCYFIAQFWVACWLLMKEIGASEMHKNPVNCGKYELLAGFLPSTGRIDFHGEAGSRLLKIRNLPAKHASNCWSFHPLKSWSQLPQPQEIFSPWCFPTSILFFTFYQWFTHQTLPTV